MITLEGQVFCGMFPQTMFDLLKSSFKTLHELEDRIQIQQ